MNVVTEILLFILLTFLWSLIGFVIVGHNVNALERRIDRMEKTNPNEKVDDMTVSFGNYLFSKED